MLENITISPGDSVGLGVLPLNLQGRQCRNHYQTKARPAEVLNAVVAGKEESCDIHYERTDVLPVAPSF
jgi:hypothetical protein